ncbi:nuclear transport factor 2 family protein [Frankia sp. AgB1.9]|uniref:nuclear transport factor 2 family protein n=1 Tax=unclassified Frankia TaxID=2632575 RepID=UPI0019331F4C|nr:MULTISPECIES: nuclear transport factor 2 family protein [unclassified Frankia]MBL7486907.1 nuclear transport factor 2 family protein [Frankia sp. AgW1.1]MBL7547206.1 nuclear transport factor 2 family protein [Frankia sp. AgB1.9]MBL7624002.1 nuclear transport factor 2 family protein [Frankia sp. AgB1.8]
MTEAVDIIAITAVQNAYAVAIDRRQWPALRDCFTADATISFGMSLQIGTLAEFLDWAVDFHTPLGRTLHQITTHQAQVRESTATASCYLHAVLVEAGRERATSVFGRYDDELIRVEDRWRIRQRRFRPAWLTTSAPAESAAG